MAISSRWSLSLMRCAQRLHCRLEVVGQPDALAGEGIVVGAGAPAGLLHFFYTFQSDGVVRRGTLRECSSAKVQLSATIWDAVVRAGRHLVS